MLSFITNMREMLPLTGKETRAVADIPVPALRGTSVLRAGQENPGKPLD